MRERQHRRIDPAHDIANAAVGRRVPSIFASDMHNATMDGCDRGRRLRQRHALDQLDQTVRERPCASFRTKRPREAHWTVGGIASEPSLDGAQRNTGIGRDFGQRRATMQMGAKCRHSPRHLRASCLRSSTIRHGDRPLSDRGSFSGLGRSISNSTESGRKPSLT